MLLRVSKDSIINTNAIIAVKATHTETKVKVYVHFMDNVRLDLVLTHAKYRELEAALGVKVL